MGRVLPNAMTLERFRKDYPELEENRYYYWGISKIFPGDTVTSNRDRYATHKWKVVAVGARNRDVAVLMEMPSRYTNKSGMYDRYWSYGSNEEGANVVRRTMWLSNIRLIEEGDKKPQFYNQEKEEEDKPMCKCRSSYCYCDSALSYEINPHSNKIEVTKGKTITISLQEAEELVSYLSTAKVKLKEAKLAELALQQEALDAAKAEIEAI
jgi:hypothetical protein